MSALSFSNTDPTLSCKNVEQLEREVKTKLPQEYCRFLLEHNGGKPTPACFSIPDLAEEAMVDVFYGLNRPFDILRWRNELKDYLPTHFLPIGRDPGGNAILMDISSEGQGAVYYWDAVRHFADSTDDSNTYRVAASFKEFLDALHNCVT